MLVKKEAKMSHIWLKLVTLFLKSLKKFNVTANNSDDMLEAKQT